MIAIRLESGEYLELNNGTTLSFTENSRSVDSNNFSFDYQDSITIPTGVVNNKLYREIGLDHEIKVGLYSDGIFMGRFYISISEVLMDINTYNGSYKLDIKSLFYKLNEDLSNAKLVDTYKYTYSNNLESIENMTDWVYNQQLNPTANLPFRFPRYSLLREVLEDYDMASTMEEEFGDMVEVNWINSSLHPQNQSVSPKTYVNKMILYQEKEIQTQNPIHPSFANVPIRLWAIVCPCFLYTEVLTKSFESLGYKFKLEYDSVEAKNFFENLLLLNNHNIFDLKIDSKIIISYSFGYQNNFTLDWKTIIDIDAKNHLPDISVSDLFYDFMVKSGCSLNIEEDTIVATMYKIQENNIEKVLNPKILTVSNKLLKNKLFIYDYINTENADNIPNYKIDNNKMETDEITSIIVPVQHRENGPQQKISYIIGEPRFNEYTEFKNSWTIIYGQSIPDELVFDTTILINYTNEVPKYCGHYMIENYATNYYLSFQGVYIDYQPMQAFDFYIDSNLWWTKGNKGLIDRNYRDKLMILKAIAIHTIKVAFNIQEYKEFEHYHFFGLQGRRVFPLNRKFTLPFSTNPQIEYEAYETAD